MLAPRACLAGPRELIVGYSRWKLVEIVRLSRFRIFTRSFLFFGAQVLSGTFRIFPDFFPAISNFWLVEKQLLKLVPFTAC